MSGSASRKMPTGYGSRISGAAERSDPWNSVWKSRKANSPKKMTWEARRIFRSVCGRMSRLWILGNVKCHLAQATVLSELKIGHRFWGDVPESLGCISIDGHRIGPRDQRLFQLDVAEVPAHGAVADQHPVGID